MTNDGVSNELMLFLFVFDTSEDMTNTLTPIIPSEQFTFFLNYIIKEDKLIMSEYDDADWQFIEATKVSDYKFDISGAVGGGSSAYLVMLKEYLGMYPEGEEDAWYTGKLLNDELYTFEPDTLGVLLGAPTSGIMVINTCVEGMEIPVPEEYVFEYIPYEKIIKNQLAEIIEGMNVLWVFKPNGTGEITVSSYWIYTNNKWVNVDDIGEPKIPIIYFNWYDGESFTGIDINNITLQVNDKKVDLIEADNGHEAGRRQFIGYIDKSSTYSVSFEKDENLPASLYYCSNFVKVNTTYVDFDEMQEIANFTTTFEPIVITFESRPVF